MIDTARLTEALRQGAAFLREAQQTDGSFLTFTSPKLNDFPETNGYTTTFVTALILQSTGGTRLHNLLGGVRRQTAHFLLGQRSPLWTYNYWPRESEQSKRRPYPDDLDDTFTVLAALQQYWPELVGPEALAAAVQVLVLCEAQVGGPYYTWVVPRSGPDVWRDVDLGVNSNVAAFWRRQGIEVPRLEVLVEEAIRARSFTTPYYAASPYPVMYFIARFYRGAELGTLRRHLLELCDTGGWWGNPQDSALAVSALLLAGGAAADVERAIARLLDTQRRGGWAAQGFYVESKRADQKMLYAGAPALSTALALEAIDLYREAQTPPATVTTGSQDVQAEAIHRVVLERVRRRFGELDTDIGRQAELALERQLTRDRDQRIVLLPYFWESALRPISGAASKEDLAILGVANLCGWLSYTIYDDFLDGEGDPLQLPLANMVMRETMRLFESLRPGNNAIAALTEGVLERIDAANTWEVARTRAIIEDDTFALGTLPDYGDLSRLADRSLGHALGPLCLLVIRGYALDDPAVQQTLRFFRHYLIARQLNDDVHDWEEDLIHGRVSAVGALLLRAQAASDGQDFRHRPLRPLIEALRKRLWQHEIENVCDLIFAHTDEARRALEQNHALLDVTKLAAMLEPLEQSARRAMQERSQTQAFIAAYQAQRRPQEREGEPRPE